MRPLIGIGLVFLVAAAELAAAERVTFEGSPLRKIESTFEDTSARNLSDDESFEYGLRIVERDGTYYWASRDMKRLVRSEGGSYITFQALDGSGYVRIFQPWMYEMMKRLPAEQRSKEIGYVEHLIKQFGSITYYGNKK